MAAKTKREIPEELLKWVPKEMLISDEEAAARPWDEQFYMWVSHGDGYGCASCESLHGEVFPEDYWKGMKPRAGNTLCKRKCRCELVPVRATRDIEGHRVEAARIGLVRSKWISDEDGLTFLDQAEQLKLRLTADESPLLVVGHWTICLDDAREHMTALFRHGDKGSPQPTDPWLEKHQAGVKDQKRGWPFRVDAKKIALEDLTLKLALISVEP